MNIKKRITNLLLCVTMTAAAVFVPGGLPIISADAASGNMTIIVSQDTYVQGSSQAAIAKGTEDPNNLIGRDWSDKITTPSAYQLPPQHRRTMLQLLSWLYQLLLRHEQFL